MSRWVMLLGCSYLLPLLLDAHAPPTPTPKAPYTVRGTGLFDADRNRFLLNGAQLALPAARTETLRILRQRWNLNAVRMMADADQWLGEGGAYLEQVAGAVKRANAEGLVVILTAAGSDAGLPGQTHAAFWAAAAQFLRDEPMLLFSLYSKPSAQGIPGVVAERRRAEDWTFWRDGGMTADGQPVVGMQQLVTAIRAAGANQVIAVPGFRDALGWQGFTPEFAIRDANVMYEAYAYFDQALSDEQREEQFGFLGARYPLYVGEWGAPLGEDSPACRAVPPVPSEASDAIQRLMLYFLVKSVSWTVAEFRPGDLIVDFATAEPSVLETTWRCGEAALPQPGIGKLLLLWLTGDAYGFGSIAADQIASAAGGPPGPLAPGQMLSLYGQLMGPDEEVQGTVDESGKLATSLTETQVWFDDVPAPIYSCGYFLLKVQVPFEVAGKGSVAVRAAYRGVISNTIRLEVADAAPEIFLKFGTVNEAAALDSGGRANSQANAYSAGDVMVLFATGLGQTFPAGVTGVPASGDPLPKPVLAVSVLIGGVIAPIEYISQAPGLIGVTQIHARLPQSAAGTGALRTAAISITAGAARSRGDARVWVR